MKRENLARISKRAFALLLFVLLFDFSCKQQQEIIRYRIDTLIIVDTINNTDTFYYAIDDLNAYFQCDSALNVVLKERDELKKTIANKKPITYVKTVTRVIKQPVVQIVKEKPEIIIKKVVPLWMYIALIIFGLLSLALLVALIKR